MRDQEKTKEELISEVAQLRQRVAELEAQGSDVKRTECTLQENYQREAASIRANSLHLEGRTEEVLKESEDRFKEFADSLPEVIFEVDLEGNLTYVNGIAFDLFGYTREDFEKGLNVLEMLIPEERIRAEKNIGRVISGETLGSVEYVAQKKNKEVFPAVMHSKGIRRDGKLSGIRGILIDVTEHKRVEEALRESEERFRAFLDNSPTVAWAKDEQGCYVYLSRTYEKRFGVRLEDWRGKTDFELWDPDIAQGFREIDQAVLAKDQMIDVEVQTRNADGSYCTWWNFKFPFRDASGRKYVGGVGMDITERKRLEKERSNVEDQLRQAQKMEALGTLAGGIAHDFNNILSAILGYAELASLDLEEGSKARNNLEHSMRAAHRARDLVEQILAFSRQAKQERKLLNLKPIVKEALKFLRASLPATIEIRHNIDNDLETIEADPTQIHQVLINLCMNAAHAMEEEGGVLEVSVSNLDLDRTSTSSGEIEAGPYVRLRVSDTGHGMPPEIMRRVFDPYFTTKERGKGTGLGLAVVHGIVKSYGGGIAVSSEVGKGSLFDIYLPRLETAAAPLEEYKAEPLPLGGHERVLFVDDEEVIVNIGREILEHLGYVVTTRASSIEALELFRTEPGRFDLVITDMTMPNMTGDRLAQELLKIRPEIPIILCTGFSEHVTEQKAKEIGIREFVMKPVVMRELAKTMRRVLHPQKKKKK